MTAHKLSFLNRKLQIYFCDNSQKNPSHKLQNINFKIQIVPLWLLKSYNLSYKENFEIQIYLCENSHVKHKVSKYKLKWNSSKITPFTKKISKYKFGPVTDHKQPLLNIKFQNTNLPLWLLKSNPSQRVSKYEFTSVTGQK